MRNFWKIILPLSLLCNAGLVWWIMQPKGVKPAPAAPAAAKPAQPQIQINTDNFDFSKTGLSDDAWKVENPDLGKNPPEAPKMPDLDDLRLLPK